jgi:hypothetical protein
MKAKRDNEAARRNVAGAWGHGYIKLTWADLLRVSRRENSRASCDD